GGGVTRAASGVACSLAASALFLGGCLRTYRPIVPHTVPGERMNATPDRVRLGFVSVPTQVEVESTATPHTWLRGARLALMSQQACREGLEFAGFEKDSTNETEGPVDVSGPHHLSFSFSPPFGEPPPLKAPSALDLELSTEN